MSNYYGTTVCNGGKVNNIEELQKVVDKYDFGNDGELNVEVCGDELQIYGFESIYARIIKDEESDYEDMFEEFLNEIAPFIDGDMTISEVGNEKCRYVCAYAYVIHNHEVKYVSLDGAIANLINNWNTK